MPAVDPTYCPDCGTELGRVEIEGRERAHCPGCDEVWWQSSVPTTSVAVVDGDAVLLIQRSAGRDAGRWDLPAGHPEYDEPAREAAARELAEETSLAVDPAALELVGTTLSTGRRRTYRSINYRVERSTVDGTPEAGSDAAAARFVAVDAVRDEEVDVRPLGLKRLRCAGLLE